MGFGRWVFTGMHSCHASSSALHHAWSFGVPEEEKEAHSCEAYSLDLEAVNWL